MDLRPRLLVIAGPTASGKTRVAALVCRKLLGEIVSADSMQIYRGMPVLTAAPTAEELKGVPCHLAAFADPARKFTCAEYARLAHAAIADICARGRLPVLSGGTGLYIDAVTRPMRFSERSDPELHARLMAEGDTPAGREALHARLQTIDPESAARLHPNDVRRVARAVEVYLLTGRTLTSQMREDAAAPGPYRETVCALSIPREALYARIDVRVDRMLEAGLVEEVARLRENESVRETAAQAIGYKEMLGYLDGNLPLHEAVARVKQASRNYAKRQMTYLRRDGRVRWVDAQRAPEAVADEIVAIAMRFKGEES